MAIDASSADPLDEISVAIHEAWDAARASQLEAFERYLTVGSLLCKARSLMPSDTLFGRWREAQGFGFSRQWASQLMTLARKEPDVRAVLSSVLDGGERVPGVDAIVQMVKDDDDRPRFITEAVRDRVLQRAGARVIALERQLERARLDATADRADVQVARFRWKKSVLVRLEEVAGIGPMEYIGILTDADRLRTRDAVEGVQDWARLTLDLLDEADRPRTTEDGEQAPIDGEAE